MTANELRVGNYLKGKKEPVVVSEIREQNWVKIHGNSSIFLLGNCFQPILLTEEWLLKLGFEQVRNCYLVRDEFEAGLDGNDFTNGVWTIIIDKKLPVKVKYVHQLQNLYSALIGEELTLEQ